MKPSAFEYYAPANLQESLALVREYGSEARLMAGGQSLMPLMNARLVRPTVIIDLNHVTELAYIQAAQQSLRIGAMTRQRSAEQSPAVREHLPLLAETLSWVGHIPIRNRGTIGGSVALGHPAAELPALAKVVDAQFVVMGADGRTRQLDPDAFFVAACTTALQPTDILTEIRLPYLPDQTGWSVQEVAPRQHDLALVGVIAVVTLDASGCCSDVRLGLFGVGDTAVRATQIEQRLIDLRPDAQTIRAAVADLPSLLDPPSDMHASAAYRREVAAVLAGRALTEAAQRARRGSGMPPRP
ncbi:MAG TPA: xanthine dehydrogenase family protein subunit M [Herpetosiphonaceae bacterium]